MLSSGELRTPTKIPRKIEMIKEDEAPPPMAATGGVVGGVPGGIPGGQLGGVIGGIVSATSNLASVPKFVPVVPQRVRISQGVTRGLLIHKEEPVYPTLARSARVQGDVILSAVIDVNGQIQNLQLVSGHPMLVPAAIEQPGHVAAGETLWHAVRIVVVADLVMSLDNVIAVAAVAKGNYALLGLGLAVSIPIVIAGSALFMALLERFPLLVWAGAMLLGWIAGDIFASDPVLARVFSEPVVEWVGTVAPPVGAATVTIIAFLRGRKARSAGGDV